VPLKTWGSAITANEKICPSGGGGQPASAAAAAHAARQETKRAGKARRFMRVSPSWQVNGRSAGEPPGALTPRTFSVYQNTPHFTTAFTFN